jgi:hypothetical protein
MSRGILCLVVTGLLCLCASGCIISSDTSSDCQAPTVGQELRELKVARDEGALAPEEYDAARHRLLSRLDKPRGR